MKDNNVPGLPGGIWSTGRRGSFKISEAAQRNAARDAARLGASNAANPTMRGLSTPSPSASDKMGSLPFAIPLQPTTKTGRSLSHSQGQREPPQSSAGPAGGTAAALPLGLLAEEDDADTESEPDTGSRLTHTMSHPPIGLGSLMRTATMPATYDSRIDGSNGRDLHFDNASPTGLLRGRTFEAAFANLSVGKSVPSRMSYQSLTSHSIQTTHSAELSGRARLAGTTCRTSMSRADTLWPTYLRAADHSRRASLACSAGPTLTKRSRVNRPQACFHLVSQESDITLPEARHAVAAPTPPFTSASFTATAATMVT